MDTDETRMGELEVPTLHPDKLLFREVTEAIIGAAFAVLRELGYGFLQKVYQRALQVELLRTGHTVELEHPITVKYRGVTVGEYFADLFVDGKVVVETKVAVEYSRADEAQLINELRPPECASGFCSTLGAARFSSAASSAESVFHPCSSVASSKHERYAETSLA